MHLIISTESLENLNLINLKIKPKISAIVGTILFLSFFLFHILGISQTVVSSSTDSISSTATISEKSLKAIDAKYAGLTSTIDKQTDKLLRRMLKKENKLRKKLSQTDSTKAAALFNGSIDNVVQSIYACSMHPGRV